MDRVITALLKHRRAVVVLFLAAALVSAACIPFVKVNYDLADYLPPSAQSTTAVQIMNEEFDEPIPNANVMANNVGLTQAAAIKDQIEAVEGVDSVLWLNDLVDLATPLEVADEDTVRTYYRDGNALFQVTVLEGFEPTAVEQLRAIVDALPDGGAVSGDAVDTAQTQSSTVEQVLMAVAIVVPIITLLLVLSTMSWIEPLLFYAAIGVSILINMGTNLVLGEVSFITYSVSPILQLAVSLDYAIFLLHAFARERQAGDGPEAAMARAVHQSASTIAASAVTTLFGFAALAFMQFQIGADLGLNLVKGIAFSFITVVFFLPALTLMLTKTLDRTTHKELMPTFKGVDKGLRRIRIPALILVALLIFPAFYGQSHTQFTYANSTPDPGIRTGRDTLVINDAFGMQNKVAVLVPRGDVASEKALGDALKKIDHVTEIMSYANSVGPTIPEAVAGKKVTDQFYSDNWARIIASVDTLQEGPEAFAAVEAIENTASDYYDTYYAAGQSANLFDMQSIVAVDNVRVSLVAVIAIFLVLVVNFRSLMLPILLLLAIESGIWINLAIPYYTDTSLNFIGYLVINTVQLGATIDYAILLTTNYLRARREMDAKRAVATSLGMSFRSILVSGCILATAGFALSVSSSLSAVTTLGLLLCRGAILSMILVTCFLPGLFIVFDRAIKKTMWHARFAEEGSSATPMEVSHAPEHVR